VERPFGSTFPFNFALVDPTELAEEVVTLGGEAVTNDASAPTTVPAELEATRRKWYVLPAVRPLTPVETVFDDVPDPASAAGVGFFVPYDVEVPYSTYHEVVWPFGFTVPPRVAVVGPTPEAGVVTATGGDAVVKRPSLPFVVAEEFLATRR
jgi:hypothetical protein